MINIVQNISKWRAEEEKLREEFDNDSSNRKRPLAAIDNIGSIDNSSPKRICNIAPKEENTIEINTADCQYGNSPDNISIGNEMPQLSEISDADDDIDSVHLSESTDKGKTYLKFRDITEDQIKAIKKHYCESKVPNLRLTADFFSQTWEYNVSAKMVKKIVQLDRNCIEEESTCAQIVEIESSEVKNEPMDEIVNNNERIYQSLSSLGPKNPKLDLLLKHRNRSDSCSSLSSSQSIASSLPESVDGNSRQNMKRKNKKNQSLVTVPKVLDHHMVDPLAKVCFKCELKIETSQPHSKCSGSVVLFINYQYNLQKLLYKLKLYPIYRCVSYVAS